MRGREKYKENKTFSQQTVTNAVEVSFNNEANETNWMGGPPSCFSMGGGCRIGSGPTRWEEAYWCNM